MKTHRPLGLPMMSFNIREEIASMKDGEQFKATRRGAKTLVKNDDLRIVLVLLSTGMAVHEHRAEGPITVSVAEGSVRFKVEAKEQVLRSGDLLTLASAIPHQVDALEESAFLITVVQPHRALTSKTDPAAT